MRSCSVTRAAKEKLKRLAGDAGSARAGTPGATSYDVQRSSGASDPYVTIATPAVNSYGDSGLTALTTYLYRVRARNGTGVSDWAVDPATTIVFTDPFLTAGVTLAKAAHISELWQAVSER
jgi:hypothetical protein